MTVVDASAWIRVIQWDVLCVLEERWLIVPWPKHKWRCVCDPDGAVCQISKTSYGLWLLCRQLVLVIHQCRGFVQIGFRKQQICSSDNCPSLCHCDLWLGIGHLKRLVVFQYRLVQLHYWERWLTVSDKCPRLHIPDCDVTDPSFIIHHYFSWKCRGLVGLDWKDSECEMKWSELERHRLVQFQCKFHGQFR